ncbi:MAG: hypothetical protein Ta2E_11900 [Mycoplasmoidaceae bacterium]|nr:MAG: hypothetical protein Ta2E_11900 [Mycoplasmoidaceae bacterium]
MTSNQGSSIEWETFGLFLCFNYICEMWRNQNSMPNIVINFDFQCQINFGTRSFWFHRIFDTIYFSFRWQCSMKSLSPCGKILIKFQKTKKIDFFKEFQNAITYLQRILEGLSPRFVRKRLEMKSVIQFLLEIFLSWNQQNGVWCLGHISPQIFQKVRNITKTSLLEDHWSHLMNVQNVQVNCCLKQERNVKKIDWRIWKANTKELSTNELESKVQIRTKEINKTKKRFSTYRWNWRPYFKILYSEIVWDESSKSDLNFQSPKSTNILLKKARRIANKS